MSGSERIQVAFSSCSVGAAHRVPAPGRDVLAERAQRGELLVALDEGRGAEHDRGAVVDRMVEDRPREHEPVEQGHGHADRNPGGEVAQHPARRRAVHVEQVADARVQRRDDVRPAAGLEPDVAVERLVEDRVDRLAVVTAALRLAPDAQVVGEVAHPCSRR